MQHGPRLRWHNGGLTSAASPRPSPASLPTCSRDLVKLYKQGRPSSHFCRRRTYSCASLCPSPCVRQHSVARAAPRAGVATACANCRAQFRTSPPSIAPQAEYPPPVIYSESSRSKLVYLVEARPPREKASQLNPGQPVAVRPVGLEDGR